jgi:hypothetical protein
MAIAAVCMDSGKTLFYLHCTMSIPHILLFKAATPMPTVEPAVNLATAWMLRLLLLLAPSQRLPHQMEALSISLAIPEFQQCMLPLCLMAG